MLHSRLWLVAVAILALLAVPVHAQYGTGAPGDPRPVDPRPADPRGPAGSRMGTPPPSSVPIQDNMQAQRSSQTSSRKSTNYRGLGKLVVGGIILLFTVGGWAIRKFKGEGNPAAS